MSILIIDDAVISSYNMPYGLMRNSLCVPGTRTEI
jgi:hypothetical protein